MAQTLNTLIAKLEDLATRFDGSDDEAAQRFRDMARDLEAGGADEAKWAFSDLRRLFDPERLSAKKFGQDDGDGIGAAEKWRNVLVLVPLAVTWVGIAWAVTAFSQLLQKDPAQAAQSFIYLWQGGFNGTMPLTLGLVAIIDGLLLGIVAILTALVYFGGTRQRATGSASEQLRREIEVTIYGVDHYLADHRVPEAVKVANRVETVARDNLTTMQELTRATLDQITASNQQHMAELRKTATDMAQQIGKEYDRFNALATKRAEEIVGLGKFTEQLQQTAVQIAAATGKLQTAQGSLVETVNGLKPPLEGMIAATSGLSRNAADVAPALSAATQQLAKMTGEQSETVSGLRELTRQQGDVAEGMATGVGSLKESVVEAARATSELSEASNYLSREQARLITALDEERRSQNELAVHVSRANYGFEQALTHFTEAVVSINSTAKDMTYAAQKFQVLEQLLQGFETGLGRIVDMQAVSAGNIEKATNRIDVAAANFEQSVQSLRQAVDILAQSSTLVADKTATQSFAGFRG